MYTMRRHGWRAGAVLCLAALTGCGLNPGNKRSQSELPPVYNPDYGIPAVARIGDIYDIYAVVPTAGLVAGGNPAELQGIFPNPATPADLAAVQGIYTVFFGNNAAAYDPGFSPNIAGNRINVIVPQGDAPGLVDVIFRDMTTLRDAAALYDGYEYLDPFDIVDVVPGAGPTAGGQQVTVVGRFPIAAPIATVAEAYSAYRVYIDARPSAFDPSFNPVITTTAMYVITPPRPLPGLVDVSVGTVVPPNESPEFRILTDGYEYLNTSFNIYQVVPSRGWIFGDESADVEGTFPVSNAFSQSLLGNIAGASQYYRVYFDFLDNGGRLAAFDSTVIDPVITATDMYVRSPYGDNVEFVDVTIVSHDNGDFSNAEFAQLQRAYKYYAMYLARVIPDSGPLPGGNVARLEGFLPGFQAIRNIYSAYAAYAVYFGNNRANFVSLVPTPVFQPSQIVSMAARIYTTGFMYVEVPPGDFPGFVDVRIEDLEPDPDRRDDTTICEQCYEYTDLDGVGRWTNAEIMPSPVGKLRAGELFVRVTVTGEIDGDDVVFLVPHGGDPSNANHRIELIQLSAGNVGGDWVWTGTNREEIPRLLANDALLVDGHAALYLFDEENDELIGDDTSDLTDGGVIEGLALEGRHCIIDTIPPRMRLVPSLERLRGDDFVSGDIPGDWNVTGAVDSATGVLPPFPHPYDYSALDGFPEVPFAGNWMERPARTESRAQVFFRVSSLSNFFSDSNYVDQTPTTNLRFVLNVIFEDVDVYQMLNRQRGSLDTNRFSGSTDRLVAGFPEDPTPPPVGVRDEVLVPNSVNQDLLAVWDFQPTSTGSPAITNITTEYLTGGPLAAGADPTLSANLQAAPTELTATYTIGDPITPTTGVDVSGVGDETLLSVVFRAVDRAGDYFPRGDTTQGRRKLFTANDTSGTDAYHSTQQPDVGPLNMWWLRSMGTRLDSSSISPSGDAATPEFTWESTGPNTRTELDPVDFLGVEKVYTYGLYRTDGVGTRDEQRDGPYTLVGSWSDWDSRTALSRADVQSLTGGVSGVWFLLVVMGCDEAGNIEVWPADQLQNPSGAGPLEIATVAGEPGGEDRNWARWFVAPTGEQLETRIEPFYWHDRGDNPTPPDFSGDGVFNATEASFGDAEVIPYPPRTTFNPNPPALITIERVMAEFRISVFSESSLHGVLWELTGNGQVLDSGEFTPGNVLNNEVFLRLPALTTDFLGSANRQPTYYTFQARGYTDTNGNNSFDIGTDIVDTSPASVQFVVVDNVPEFIQRRNSEDAQPIQEMDRPQ